MMNVQPIEEVILTHHTEERWRRRDLERMDWIHVPKIRILRFLFSTIGHFVYCFIILL